LGLLPHALADGCSVVLVAAGMAAGARYLVAPQ